MTSYGTPDQMASLLTSITGNVREEPIATWTHPGVRVASRELAELLQRRLADAVDEALIELGVTNKDSVSLEDGRGGDMSDRTST